MIAIDPSVIMAIVLGEDDADALTDMLLDQDRLVMAAGSALELEVTAWRRGRAPLRDRVNLLLDALGITIVPMDLSQLQAAKDGYGKYGIGRGEPPSALNFGDCFSYGLAKAIDAPLLFKGDDFDQTDIPAAHP